MLFSHCDNSEGINYNSPQDYQPETAWVYDESEDELDLFAADIQGRDLEYVVIHTDATFLGREFYSGQQVSDYATKTLGWSRPNYWFWVRRDGKIFPLRPYSDVDCVVGYTEFTYHAKGYNNRSIGISYSSSLPRHNLAADTMNKAQEDSIANLLRVILNACPTVKIVGHRDLSSDDNGDGIITKDEWDKTCPNFDAAEKFNYVIREFK